jgi:hypothetical protein
VYQGVSRFCAPSMGVVYRWCNSRVAKATVAIRSRQGCPSGGGPLSPLLANFMLDDLDKELGQRGHRIQKLNMYLNGWSGYFRIVETPSLLKSFDEWIRRRLRMCLLKQWKRPKTRTRNRMMLGLPKEWAALDGGSRKGYWRLANTPQMNKALGLAYWRAQGLTSLVKRYSAFRSTT